MGGGGGGCLPCPRPPQEADPPQKVDAPKKADPSLESGPPQKSDPNSEGRHTPPGYGYYYGIRSTSGWNASYYNAYLFNE